MDKITPFKWYNVKDKLPPKMIEILVCFHHEDSNAFFGAEIGTWLGDLTSCNLLVVEITKAPNDWIPANYWMFIELPTIEHEEIKCTACVV
jgi:hypothetical protein